MYLMNQIQNLIQISKESAEVEPYYEVLEYIQFDGTQYYNLGFKSQLGTGYEIGVQFDDLGSAGCGVCGSRDNSSASENNIGTFVGSSTSVVSDYNNSSYTGSRYTVPKTDLNTSNWYDVYNYQTKRGIRLNGAEVGTPNTTTATTAFTTVNDFYLGGYNGFNLTPFKGKIRYFKSVSPTLDLIPVLDSQMRPCFYDKISKQFYYHTNSTGSTTPTYKRWNKFDVDFIESTGTQYIDSGLLGTQNSAIFADIMLNTYSGTTTQRIFGNYYSTSRAVTMNCNSNTTVRFDGKSATQTSCPELVLTPNTRHIVGIDKTGVNIDNVYEYTWVGAVSDFTTGGNVVILASSDKANPQPSTIKNGLEGRCYGIKWFENGTLIRDYKPVVWHNGNTTAVACLYDEVYNKMYQNIGDGSFKAYVVSSNDTVYEVGTSMTTTKSGTTTVIQSVTSGCYIDLGLEANDVMIVNAKTNTTSTNSNYLSGCRAKKPTGDTANPPILFAVSGSATGSKISATVNNSSGLAKSYNSSSVATDWERTGNYTYQLTISAYQRNDLTYFKAIGYSYTLDKEMIPIDETQAVCTITSGGVTNTYNTIADVPDKYKSNMMFGAIKVVDSGTGTSENNMLANNNTHYFYELYEQGQPIVRFLPVRNATNTSTIGMFNTVNRTFVPFTKVLATGLTITYSFTALS